MTTWILTLYNKPDYVQEAIRSVEQQTRTDLVHIVRPDTYRSWDGRYPPAVAYNEWALEVPVQDYVCWLSDDDLLLPNYVADLAGYLDGHAEAECVYGGSYHVAAPLDAPERLLRNLPEEQPFPIFNAQKTPGYKIDGGQFLIRRSALERVPYPYYPEGSETARSCDAHYMNKLVAFNVLMYPVAAFVLKNRATPKSGHVAVDAQGGVYTRDWRALRR